ncbi:septal ring lytic transglycosylase RlpA family protein [Vibrio sp.]|nr:septal ring lytic transglycosylase RlpA family protein [Vibrio sp.]
MKIKHIIMIAASALLVACSSVKGKTSAELLGWTDDGGASFYGKRYHGRTTASGEKFNMWAMTAAHKELPFGTRVRVTNLDNGKSIIVKINDRGPFIRGRIIDLSRGSFAKIASISNGVVDVEIEVIK